MAGMVDGCYIYGRPNPADLVECEFIFSHLGMFYVRNTYVDRHEWSLICFFFAELNCMYMVLDGQIKRGSVEVKSPFPLIFYIRDYEQEYTLPNYCLSFNHK